jgi:hypothetical protein
MRIWNRVHLKCKVADVLLQQSAQRSFTHNNLVVFLRTYIELDKILR